MESELFGYEKGAFTGAVGAKPGRFELAARRHAVPRRDRRDPGRDAGQAPARPAGVASSSASAASRPSRSTSAWSPRPTATSQQEIARGNFREDLFYRLNVVPIHIPPLRERREDIPLLVEHFIAKFNERLKKQIAGIADEALARAGGLPLAGQHPRARERDRADDPVLRGARDPRAPTCRPSVGRTRPPAATRVAGAGRRAARRRRGADAAPAARRGSLKEAVRAETERVERELISAGARRDRRQRHPGGAQAEDLAQEPADEDEGVGPARAS